MSTQAGMRSSRAFYDDAITLAKNAADSLNSIRHPLIPGSNTTIQQVRKQAGELLHLADLLLKNDSLSGRTIFMRDLMRESVEAKDYFGLAFYTSIEVKAAMDEWMLPLLLEHPDISSVEELDAHPRCRTAEHYVAMEALWIHQWLPQKGNQPFLVDTFKLIFQTAVAGWRNSTDGNAEEIFERLLQVLQQRGKQAEALVKLFRTVGAGASDARYEAAMKVVYAERNKFTDDKLFKLTYMALAHGWLNAIGVEEVHGIITAE